MSEFVIANMAPLMFCALVVFLLLGYPVAFALGAVGISFGLLGVYLGPEDELLLYVIHGTLHLAGYLDGSRQEKTEMQSRQQAYLARFGLKPRKEP